MRKALGGWGRFGVVLAVVALARPVAAADTPRIEVVIAADALVTDSVLAVLRNSLARRGVIVDASAADRIDPLQLVHPAPGDVAHGPVARVWLDFLTPQPTMYFVTEPSGLVYVRRLAVHPAPDTVELELIRFVVDGAVQAILEGQQLGVSPVEFERSLVPVPAPPARPAPPISVAPAAISAPRKWVVAVGYSGSRWSGRVIAHGPTLTAELMWPRLRLAAALLQRLPLTVSAPAVTASSPDISAALLSSGIRLFAAFPVWLGARLWASLGVGAGLDVTRVAPAGTGATATFWVTDPLVLGIATVQQSFGHLIAAVDAGLDFDLVAPRYAAVRPGETVAVWTPERWRPFVTARLGIVF